MAADTSIGEGAAPAGRSRRRGLLLAAVGSVVALFLALGYWTASAARRGDLSPAVRGGTQALDTGPRSGPAPAFTLPDLAAPAAQVSLARFRGRPVLVNFWASWCVPCRREMPRLEAAYRRYAGRVAFVGIDYRDQDDDARAFVAKTGVTYPSGVDGDGAVGTRYGIYGLPTTVFVDAQGRIVGRFLGEMSAARLDTALTQLVPSRSRA